MFDVKRRTAKKTAPEERYIGSKRLPD
jgi:hypothetical protein